MLDRILIPLDGSSAMTATLPTIRQFVSGTGAKVHLLVVRPMPCTLERRGDRVVYLDELVREEHAAWQAYLIRAGSALAYDGIVVSREVRFGEPVEEILAAATRRAVLLIALAAPVPSWGERLFRPGLAQQLMAKAQVPVLVVPPGCPPVRGVKLRYSQVAA